MPRLGELLVAARLLTAEQVEQALRAQVMWGGRLGTALVELGFIDLDGLTRALGRQVGLPAALARHFEKADRAIQAKLPAALAAKHSAIPLLQVGTNKIAVAVMDKLAKPARSEIATALGVAVGELVLSIAPEQRVMYQLERVYGIPRSARFLRVQGPAATVFPELGEVPVPIDSDPEVVVPAAELTPSPAASTLATAERQAIPEPIDAPDMDAPVDDIAALIDRAVESAVEPPSDQPAGRDRRSYVRTVTDEEPAATALGRIAIRKMAITTASIPVIEEAGEVPRTLADAARAIKRAAKRDRVAELAIDALARFAPMCDAAMLMIVRGTAVIGWRWFCRTSEPPAELAVSTQDACLITSAIADNTIHRAPLAELGPVDSKLVRALGVPEGELVVVPVPIASRVMCVVAAIVHGEASATAIEPLEAIAGAASAAFARLVRDASR
jgi:hypothetical protein